MNYKTKYKTLLPGSNCVYYKLYTSESFANSIIVTLYDKIILKHKNLIKSFFFIRYKDPYFHIRIRFFVFKDKDIDALMSAINNLTVALYKNKRLWKVQIDTYEREIERYEAVPIDKVECFFYKESSFLCETIKKNIDNDNIWHIAIWAMDTYLSCCNYDMKTKIHFTEIIGKRYKEEFGFDSNNSKSLSNIYRENKSIIRDIIENRLYIEYNTIIVMYKDYCVDFFKTLITKTDLDGQFKFLYSIIHMLNNRSFIHYNRLYEMIMYDFLLMFYKSKIARNTIN
jgi:thiopeptide-type bacteriocin biosynthesis protein